MNQFCRLYPFKRRIIYTVTAIAGAILLAGFWNYHLVDGFGKEVIAGNTIGDTTRLADNYSSRGGGFGFIFAAVAGLAATFTACNCVVFAMIPSLACSAESRSTTPSPWRALGIFVAGVLTVTAIYGFYIGAIGAEGVAALNERPTRLAQAQWVFTFLGIVMFLWGLLEMGFMNFLNNHLPPGVKAILSRTTTKALLLGLLVGFFAIGRPFPVFREFLLYAASANSPLYGAAVMVIQGAGQILVMALLFFCLIWFAGDKITSKAQAEPHKFQMVSSLALITGGAYFIYYWGLAFLFDIGQWGFKLGWY